MPKSPFERKIDKTQSELEQFKENNDAVIDSIEEDLLLLQRFVAKESITNMANSFIEKIWEIEDQIEQDSNERKLIVEFTSALSKINISESPLEVASDFRTKCFDKMHELGFHFLNDPL